MESIPKTLNLETRDKQKPGYDFRAGCASRYTTQRVRKTGIVGFSQGEVTISQRMIPPNRTCCRDLAVPCTCLCALPHRDIHSSPIHMATCKGTGRVAYSYDTRDKLIMLPVIVISSGPLSESLHKPDSMYRHHLLLSCDLPFIDAKATPTS